MAAFPADEPLETQALERTARLVVELGKIDHVWISPALRTRQTAEILSLVGAEEPALRDCDHGRWTGRAIADIYSDEPENLAAWMTDVQAAPHGGEPLSVFFERVADWTEQRQGDGGHTVAVTHASVIRAAIMHVLQAPAAAFWKIDVEPLSVTEMSSDGRRWALRLASRAHFKS